MENKVGEETQKNREQKVEFKVGEETLRGSLFVPEGNGPFPGIVLYHGRGSNRTRYLDISQKFSENSIMALAFDFRGCGESDGKFEDQMQRMGIDDARAGLNFLLEQNIDRNRIGMVGSSFGGYVGAILFEEYDFIESAVFRAPAVYPDVVLDTHVDSIQDLDYPREEWLSSIAFKGIEAFKGSLLIIESEKDEVVKPWVVKEYYQRAVNANKRELFVHRGAPHSHAGRPDLKKQFDEKAFAWFLETL